jgi:hypothetical protein
MPHVIVKLWPGKSEQQKARLAEEIVKDVMDVFPQAITAGNVDAATCEADSQGKNQRNGHPENL